MHCDALEDEGHPPSPQSPVPNTTRLLGIVKLPPWAARPRSGRAEPPGLSGERRLSLCSRRVILQPQHQGWTWVPAPQPDLAGSPRAEPSGPPHCPRLSWRRVPSDPFSTSREPGTPGRTQTRTPQGIFSAHCGCPGLSVSGCTGRYSSRPLTAPGTWVQPGVCTVLLPRVRHRRHAPPPRHRHPPVPALCPGLLWSLYPALVANASSSAATVPRLPLTPLSPTPWAALPPTQAHVLGSSQPHTLP